MQILPLFHNWKPESLCSLGETFKTILLFSKVLVSHLGVSMRFLKALMEDVSPDRDFLCLWLLNSRENSSEEFSEGPSCLYSPIFLKPTL